MKLTKILLITILVLIVALFAIIWLAPDDSQSLEIEEPLIFAGDVSEETKQEWLKEYKLGLSLMEEEDYSAAIEVFENAIAVDPDNGEAYFQIGKAYDQLKMNDAIWYYKAAAFLYEGNTISEFEYDEANDETEARPIETEPSVTHVSAENAGWQESDLRLSKVTRYSEGNVLMVYTFQYDQDGKIVGFKEDDYWDGDGKLSFTDIWEYTYNEDGKILKEQNLTHSNKTTYEYTYVNGLPVRCLMSLEGVGYRTYTIGANSSGYVATVVGKGVYDPEYEFELAYTHDESRTIPIRARGSETLSTHQTKKYYEYIYYPALMQIVETRKTEGFSNDSVWTSFRIDDFQLASLPDFYVPDGGCFVTNKDGFVTEIYDKNDVVLWELSYEKKPEAAKSAGKDHPNRRIARINEYNSKGVTETNTFTYDKEGRLESYTTTYYDKGNPVDKDIWTFAYNDNGQLFEESRDRGEEDYLSYIHIRNEGIEGYQTMYGRGIQQQFYYKFDDDGVITGIRGEGVHDYYFTSNMEYSYDIANKSANSSGTLSSAENADYQISKKYDFSYSGVVIVEDKTSLNGSELPISRYLRVDMPEYIALPEVIFYGSDEIITDDDGYIVKILDKSGALRCELIFDYC